MEATVEATGKDLEEAHTLASVTYDRAAQAFDLATAAYRASVMAYDVATGSNESAMFDPPETEAGQ